MQLPTSARVDCSGTREVGLFSTARLRSALDATPLLIASNESLPNNAAEVPHHEPVQASCASLASILKRSLSNPSYNQGHSKTCWRLVLTDRTFRNVFRPASPSRDSMCLILRG